LYKYNSFLKSKYLKIRNYKKLKMYKENRKNKKGEEIGRKTFETKSTRFSKIIFHNISKYEILNNYL
jgi:hypothetical protein